MHTMGLLAAIGPAPAPGAAGAATTMDWVLLWVSLALALGVSFLCSMLEASILSMTPSYTNLLVRRGSRAGRLLQRMKANIDRPLSAILTLNTVAHTVGAAGVGAQVAAIFGRQWLGVASAVLTALILFLSEIIPKTLGAVWHKRLAAFTAYTIQGMILLLWPIVGLCMWLGQWVGGTQRAQRMTREELASLAHLGREDGALRRDEYRVMRNLIELRNVRLKDVMTPRHVVTMHPVERTVGELMRDAEPPRFARMPVYRDNPDHLIGFVPRYEILRCYHAGENDQTLEALAQPLLALPEHASVADALRQLVAQQQQIAQVVDEYGGTAGIVTFEDTIESLLGVEIVDETDPAPDMRELAKRRQAIRQDAPPPGA